MDNDQLFPRYQCGSASKGLGRKISKGATEYGAPFEIFWE
jgi:hypothetical protein